MHVVLFEPEIPPNTGNIIRLCANCGVHLHLIEPLGFDISDKRLRRAGLDYGEFVDVKTYASIDDFIVKVNPGQLYACSTNGASSLRSKASFSLSILSKSPWAIGKRRNKRKIGFKASG